MKMLHAGIWLAYLVSITAILAAPNSFSAGIWADAIGIILLVGGGWLMMWAKNWMGRHYHRIPKIKPSHSLVTTGPYALTRHPEYLGIISGFLGLSLVLKSITGLAACVLVIIPLHAYLALKEEHLLGSHFKEKHEEYKKKVGVVPKLVKKR